MNLKQRAFFFLSTLLIITFASPIGWSFWAIRGYVNLRLEGFDHNAAMCALPEWTDNMLRFLSWENVNDIRKIQLDAFDYYCEGNERTL